MEAVGFLMSGKCAVEPRMLLKASYRFPTREPHPQTFPAEPVSRWLALAREALESSGEKIADAAREVRRHFSSIPSSP